MEKWIDTNLMFVKWQIIKLENELNGWSFYSSKKQNQIKKRKYFNNNIFKESLEIIRINCPKKIEPLIDQLIIEVVSLISELYHNEALDSEHFQIFNGKKKIKKETVESFLSHLKRIITDYENGCPVLC